MKKFTINCLFDNQPYPVGIFIGTPKSDHHPIHFQNEWLSKERGGTVPQEIMQSLEKLQVIAKKNKVLLEDLCVYSLGIAGK